MNKERAKVICMTPTKNEEWIIERFVYAAALWADAIIIADQMSTDQTVALASKCSKVHIIENCSEVFNENERQKLLIEEARKIQGKKLLIALDADEFLTANFLESSEWSNMLYADEGTVFNMEWPFIMDDFKHYWEADEPFNKFAVMDDGSPHIGTPMHSIRIPMMPNASEVYLKEIKVMHFQFTDWKRMESKHLWYQCYERVTYPKKSIFEIYRLYHHMYTPKKYHLIPEVWLANYRRREIRLDIASEMTRYWWDTEIEKFLRDYGIEYFKYIDMQCNQNIPLLYLRHTQRYYRNRIGKAVLRRMDNLVWRLMNH